MIRPRSRRLVLLLALALVPGLLACRKTESPPGNGSAPATPAAPETPAATAAATPRHLLLVSIDTLRADAVGAYGKNPSPTPHLDRLAREGTRFRRVQSHVPLTLPSHATLFTGQLPFEHGVRNNGTYALPESASTLAEMLQGRGFTTGAAVASFVLAKKFGLAQGFATYNDDLGANGSSGGIRDLRAEIPASQVYGKWQSWLSRLPAGQPFFYWAHFYDPHLPYEPPAELRGRFGSGPEGAYAGELAAVDRELGRMFADLESRGLLADTLVVVTSDHGEGFGEHGEWGHGLLTYQESLEVPLVLRGPGAPSGREIDTRVGLVDLLPSLLELFGAPLPQGLSGHSFRPLLTASPVAADESRHYFESLLGQEDRNWAPITGLLVGEHKLIAVPRAEMYNLAADAGEKQNLVDSERRRWRELDEMLRGLLLGKKTTDASRAADEQDLATLRSLGYVSAGGAAGKVLDPKDGIALDRQLQEVEKSLAAGTAEARRQARQQLEAARAAWQGVEQPAFYLLEHRLRAADGDRAGALATLRRGVARLPEVYPLRFELLRALYEARQFADATTEAGHMLARDPGSVQVLTLLGKSRLGAGDPAGALAAFEKALQGDPGNPDLQLDVAMLYAQSGQTARAFEYFEQGLARQPRGFYLLTYALLLAREGRTAEAGDRMEQALRDHLGELNAEQQQLARQALSSWGRS